VVERKAHFGSANIYIAGTEELKGEEKSSTQSSAFGRNHLEFNVLC
jgi:hypothetical protein